MNRQFFGKESLWWMLTALVVYLLAALAWWQPFLTLPLLLAAGITVAVLTKKDFVLGLGILFLELIIGGHGLLLHADIGVGLLTLRHVVFLGFFAGYALRLLMRQEFLKSFHATIALLGFVLWLSFAFLVGGLENGWSVSFDEFNSFFYFALLIPIFGHAWTHTEKRSVLTAAFAGIAFLALSTLLFGYTYGHVPGKVMNIPYMVYRDARVTEVSLQVVQNPPAGIVQFLMAPWLDAYPYWYRIFNPSQVFFLVGLCLYGAYALLHGVDQSIRKHWILIVSLLAAGLFVGMSRSLILALGVSVSMLFASLLVLRRVVPVPKFAGAVGAATVSVALAALIFVLVAALPIPTRPDLRDATFYATSAGTTRQAAVTSRWSLLEPLHEAIVRSPIVGYGFGKALTYNSADPRIIAETGGAYTTYRFEWGYHDLMLKIGIVGLGLYLYLLYRLFGHAIRAWRTLPWLHMGLSAAVLAVGVAHVFTPYLNHPLGIGIILLAAIIIGEPAVKGQKVEQKEGNILMTFPSISPVSVVMEDRG